MSTYLNHPHGSHILHGLLLLPLADTHPAHAELFTLDRLAQTRLCVGDRRGGKGND